MAINIWKYASPQAFFPLAGKLAPWFLALAGVLGAVGLYIGLLVAPSDFQQGDAYRIIFIHVPSAWMSMFIYFVMGVASVVAVVWRIKLAEVVAMQSAPIGAAFTCITLVSGSLWGKPMWGTWWTWDARLTSELVLLFLYLGVIGLYHAFEDRRQGARAAGFLAIIGVINVPIVHFSVNWWNTLHQGSTINFFGTSKIAADMLWPLLVLTLATKLYYVASLCRRARADLLALEGNKAWVHELVAPEVAP